MLLEFGNTVVDDKWFVEEPLPTGFCRIYYIHSGDVTYQSENQKLRLLPGYAYVMPSVTPYSLHRNVEVEFSCTYLHLDPSPYFVSETFRLAPSEDPLFYHYLESIRAAIAQGNTEMLHKLADLFMTFCEGQPGVRRVSPEFEAVLTFIASHLHEKISLRTLGEQMGYNPNYFIDLFRKETGVSPHQYIIRRRLQKAILLLRENRSVTEVAEAVGFSDANSLARAFKAQFGVSPSRFRHVLIKP